MSAATLVGERERVPPGSAGVAAASDWRRLLEPYARPRAWRSLLQLAGNLGGYLGLWVAMWWLADRALWASLLLTVPAAGFILRTFSIQHDCGHGSFLPSRKANDWVGRLVVPVAITPYGYWRMAHAVHHATVGHLDRQGVGDIGVLTVDEFRARSWLRRLLYRAYRNPIVLFGIGPAFQYYVRFRLPYDLPAPKAKARNSILLTNAALLVILLAIHATLGLGRFFLLWLPTMTLAATVGLWLFYVHHHFEHTYWARENDWSQANAATEGSSYFALPAVLRFFTGSTGIHHAHHACPRIPNYRLREALAAHPELRSLNAITLRKSFSCGRLSLWDERSHRLISFREERASRNRKERACRT